MPFLTIITITYNAGKYLERTLKSIDNQTCKAFEYLLIDGGSTDDTLGIAGKYEHLFTTVVSERDDGLYDAMNKGLRLATGDYVWFMNAGDEINEPTTVENLQRLAKNQPDIIYGETFFVEDTGKNLGIRSELTPHKLPTDLHWKQMNLGMLVCHQSFIVKRSLAPVFIKNNLSADIDWEINALKKSQKIVQYDGVLSKYLIGGISNQQLQKSLIDRFKVLRHHFGLRHAIVSHVQILNRGLKKVANKRGKYW